MLAFTVVPSLRRRDALSAERQGYGRVATDGLIFPRARSRSRRSTPAIGNCRSLGWCLSIGSPILRDAPLSPIFGRLLLCFSTYATTPPRIPDKTIRRSTERRFMSASFPEYDQPRNGRDEQTRKPIGNALFRVVLSRMASPMGQIRNPLLDPAELRARE